MEGRIVIARFFGEIGKEIVMIDPEALFTSLVEALMFSLCSDLRGFPWITCNSSS